MHESESYCVVQRPSVFIAAPINTRNIDLSNQTGQTRECPFINYFTDFVKSSVRCEFQYSFFFMSCSDESIDTTHEETV